VETSGRDDGVEGGGGGGGVREETQECLIDTAKFQKILTGGKYRRLHQVYDYLGLRARHLHFERATEKERSPIPWLAKN
jgi:hypothetical protein